MRRNERGEGLVEVVVAAAIASLTVGAVVTALIAATHRFGAQPVDEALRQTVARELRVAVDVLKYQGGWIAPVTVATTAPLPGGSPLPVHVSISSAALTGGGCSVSVSASADASGERATMTTTVAQPAPLPSSQMVAPQSGEAPL